jgi:hypothetical protein
MTFALDIRKFADKVNARADDVVRELVIGLHAKIDERSPVGDASYWKHPAPKGYVGGRFRGNWRLGVGSAPTGELNRVDPDGGTVRVEISAAIPERAAGNVFYLANNVPYALRIEHGWSRQAPTGVVGLTVAEFDTIIRGAVEQAKAANP